MLISQDQDSDDEAAEHEDEDKTAEVQPSLEPSLRASSEDLLEVRML